MIPIDTVKIRAGSERGRDITFGRAIRTVAAGGLVIVTDTYPAGNRAKKHGEPVHSRKAEVHGQDVEWAAPGEELPPAKVSWASIGSVEPGDAATFAVLIQTAAAIAEAATDTPDPLAMEPASVVGLQGEQGRQVRSLARHLFTSAQYSIAESWSKALAAKGPR